MGIGFDLQRRGYRNTDFDDINDYISAVLQDDADSSHAVAGQEEVKVKSKFSPSVMITIKRLYAPSLLTSASQLLDVFWTDALDSDCVLCQKSFNHINPPIRTVSLESQSPFIIEIHNRHLFCINRYPVQYIPISHVWHSHITISNLTTKSTPEAS
ncbi:hypothetical protein K469DRAFT_707489 [Zopfia rhizophila CBS 207.26]|uniref:Uncharacterized protein n=1 Tax=Zopfia rhizophila CBS 207.26 TaxID=1314779 RepID=A0A6A6E5H3_9PEZI|nr:hypothetical protein K469DRAFT_707489 [Zopfia rhizophila CBS 207.26]